MRFLACFLSSLLLAGIVMAWYTHGEHRDCVDLHHDFGVFQSIKPQPNFRALPKVPLATSHINRHNHALFGGVGPPCPSPLAFTGIPSAISPWFLGFLTNPDYGHVDHHILLLVVRLFHGQLDRQIFDPSNQSYCRCHEVGYDPVHSAS